jgi:hypothetical protein
MTYASPASESAADTHFMKLQRLQNKILRVIGGFWRRTPTHHMHMVRKRDNTNVCSIGRSEAQHRNHKRMNLVAVKRTIVQMSKLL